MELQTPQNQPIQTKSFIAVNKDDLAAIPVFSQLSEVEREAVASITDKKLFFMGNRVFCRGDPGGQLFIVHKGVVKITRSIRGNFEQSLAIKKSGDLFGKVSFFDNQNQYSTAVCVTDSMIFIINKAYFDELTQINPVLGVKILRSINISICSQLRKTNSSFNRMVKYVRCSG
jgi:CRP/FNR family transcriptional regulator